MRTYSASLVIAIKRVIRNSNKYTSYIIRAFVRAYETPLSSKGSIKIHLFHYIFGGTHGTASRHFGWELRTLDLIQIIFETFGQI